jgi:uncharacterized membrane protein
MKNANTQTVVSTNYTTQHKTNNKLKMSKSSSSSTSNSNSSSSGSSGGGYNGAKKKGGGGHGHTQDADKETWILGSCYKGEQFVLCYCSTF